MDRITENTLNGIIETIKNNAEAQKQITELFASAIGDLQNQIDELKEEIKQLKGE